MDFSPLTLGKVCFHAPSSPRHCAGHKNIDHDLAECGHDSPNFKLPAAIPVTAAFIGARHFGGTEVAFLFSGQASEGDPIGRC
jgi:hypothetical protein